MRLLIDSRDRTEASTIQNAVYVLDQPLEHFKTVRVDHAVIYNTFFNIDSKNNVLRMDAVNLVIVPGYYTQATLAAAIDVKMKTVDAATSCVWSPTALTATWTLGAHTLSNANSTIRDCVGITELAATLTGTLTTRLNTSGPQSVLFDCPELSISEQRSVHRRSLHSSPFLSVPVYAGYQTINYYQTNFPIVLPCDSSGGVSVLTISYTDGQGRELLGGIDYQMPLTFE